MANKKEDTPPTEAIGKPEQHAADIGKPVSTENAVQRSAAESLRSVQRRFAEAFERNITTDDLEKILGVLEETAKAGNKKAIRELQRHGEKLRQTIAYRRGREQLTSEGGEK
jgi:hypothetical protein